MTLLKRIIFFTIGGLFFLSLIGFVLRVWKKISTGHGLDYYKTYWEVEFSYTGVFVLMLLLPLVWIIPAIYHHLQNRAEKDLVKKYGKK